MRLAGTLALLTALAYGAAALVATPVSAQPRPTATTSPDQGPAGTTFTLSWSNLYLDPDCRDYTVQLVWDTGQVIGTGRHAGRGRGSGTATVPPGAPPGPHTVTARPLCAATGTPTATFTVAAPTTTTNTTPPTTTTTAPPPTTTTTTPPRTTTTTPPTTTTTTDTPPPTSATTTTEPFDGDGALTLDKDNVQPGDPLTATGTGCTPGTEVKLSSLGEDVGTTRADPSGTFSTRIEFKTLQPGRHVIRADCGVVLVGSVDVALTSSTAGTTSTLVVLGLFLLLATLLVRRQFTGLFTKQQT